MLLATVRRLGSAVLLMTAACTHSGSGDAGSSDAGARFAPVPPAAPTPAPEPRIHVTRSGLRLAGRDVGLVGSTLPGGATAGPLRELARALGPDEPALVVADADADARSVRDLVLALGALDLPQARVRLQLAGAPQAVGLATPPCSGAGLIMAPLGGAITPGPGLGGLGLAGLAGSAHAPPPPPDARLAPTAAPPPPPPDPGGVRPCAGPPRHLPQQTEVRLTPNGVAVTIDGTSVATGCHEMGRGVTVPRTEGMLAELQVCLRRLRDIQGADAPRDVRFTALPGVRFADLWGALTTARTGADGKEMFPEASVY